VTGHTGLLLALGLLAVIVGIVWLTARWRVNAFLVLILASFVFGAYASVLMGRPPLLDAKSEAGAPVEGLVTIIARGFGGTLTSIGLVILFGTILGHFLKTSGAAFVMAETILRLVGRKRAPLAMGLAGYVVSIPVFCDSGFIVLSALNKALAADAGIPMVVMATALSMGLYSTHTLVPPTPGPLAAAGNLGADVGLVMLLGLIAALPAALAGVLFARRQAGRFAPAVGRTGAFEEEARDRSRLPSRWKSFLPIVAPVFLIGAASIANLEAAPLGNGSARAVLSFLGHPVVALALGMALAALAVPEWSREILDGWVGAAIKDSALVLVITAAGGSLGAVIKATGLGDFIGESLSAWHLGLLLPFAISAAIKTAQGSSTVALVTTSAILAPLLPALGWTGGADRALAVLAIGAGSMVVSHANDSYFWVVSQFSGLDVSTAYRAQTLGSLVTGITAFCGILVLSVVL
jgi:GntP family gluconate:H+ symporter